MTGPMSRKSEFIVRLALHDRRRELIQMWLRLWPGHDVTPAETMAALVSLAEDIREVNDAGREFDRALAK